MKKNADAAVPAAPAERPAVYNSSLARGIQILEAFDEGADLGLLQITQKTGLEKSAAQRFVATLVQVGYLNRNATTRRYSLSPKILGLGARYLRADPLIERARPYLIACNSSTGETVNLAVREGRDIILVSRYSGIQMVRPNIVVGSKFPWYVSSVGQAITAFLPGKEIDAMLEEAPFTRYARQTLTTRRELERRLIEIREQGFSLTADEAYDGDISIAAPVFDSQRLPLAAVSIAVLSSSWTTAQVRKKFSATVIELANAISHTKNYAPGI